MMAVGVAPRVAFIMDPEHFPHDLLSLNGTALPLQPPPSLYSNTSRTSNIGCSITR